MIDLPTKRVTGRIIKLQPDVIKGGWGFISSVEIPFTRIFFHWTSLLQDTLNFADLTVGMNVEFIAIGLEGKGIRAIKIKVIDATKIAQQKIQQEPETETIGETSGEEVK